MGDDAFILLPQPGLIGFHLLAWAAVAHVLLTKTDPRSALGWAAVLLMVPVVGLTLYVIFGISRTQSRAAAIMRRHARILPDYAREDSSLQDTTESIPLWLERMERVGRSLTHKALLGGNSVEPLFNGNMAYPRMVEAIRRAQRHVLLTTYIFKDGEAGRSFTEALIAAHRRGCQVRVLVDGVGRLYSLHSPMKRLRAAGIPVALFLPPSLFPPNLMVNLRNHRKVLVCDGTVFTGGMNIADYHVLGRGGRHEVQDVHFELTGPIAASYYRCFFMDWGFATRAYDSALPEAHFPATGRVYCRTALDGPGPGGDALNDLIAGSISSAIYRVWVMTPYLLPTREIMAALRASAQRGVDTRVILPAKNNLCYVHWASQRILPTLIEAGVRVFYQPPPFAHTKLLCVDDYYTQIGSVNYDSRSLRLNFEMNTELFDRAFCSRMAAFMEETMQHSREVRAGEVEAMPLYARLRSAVFWLFSPYL